VVDDFATAKSKAKKAGAGIGLDGPEGRDTGDVTTQGELALDEFTRAIIAKIVQKCGTREYWDTWAKDIAKIAQAHITRITAIVGQEGPERSAFLAFLDELQDDLNPEIAESEAIEMLAQHLITRPVFDALFKGSQFTQAKAAPPCADVCPRSSHRQTSAPSPGLPY
jgi:predicted helicase